ncbi:hypothetical protein PPERSA_03201 [Pseudocohnilembus persalinus]|uniref:Uncharacterized protein n=1 Tax=Pseudocohnilembus persalinus TaxID=266149 RepID=A0A0V0QE35_PSEPJ|nr:hypothetical protein PPERSA_03201 [Pseudocohnilembus persalinus]|eukprot:KRX00468.1 hypothetical protein PPERSA_03201 [Pseudocohnilembus persalinus]
MNQIIGNPGSQDKSKDSLIDNPISNKCYLNVSQEGSEGQKNTINSVRNTFYKHKLQGNLKINQKKQIGGYRSNSNPQGKQVDHIVNSKNALEKQRVIDSNYLKKKMQMRLKKIEFLGQSGQLSDEIQQNQVNQNVNSNLNIMNQTQIMEMLNQNQKQENYNFRQNQILWQSQQQQDDKINSYQDIMIYVNGDENNYNNNKFSKSPFSQYFLENKKLNSDQVNFKNNQRSQQNLKTVQ